MFELADGTVVYLGCNAPSSPRVFADVPHLKADYPHVSFADAKRYLETKVFSSKDWFADYIDNQGKRGSCNGYAGAKALERARARRRLERVPLSGEGLYAQINGGQDNGSQLVDGMRAIVEKGIPPKTLVPYEEYLYNRIDPKAWEAAKNYRGLELYQLKTEGDLITATVLGFDCVIAVHVNSDWMKMNPSGMIPPQPGPGNHAIGLDDIRYSKQKSRFEFLHYGSWGKDVHDNGYAWLSWDGHMKTTVGYHGFYAIRGTVDGDNSDEDTGEFLPVV